MYQIMQKLFCLKFKNIIHYWMSATGMSAHMFTEKVMKIVIYELI